MQKDNDAVLIAQVVTKDDHRAFAFLVKQHQSSLRNFLRRLTGNKQEQADDLAQETFIKAYKALHTFKGNAKFSSWLYRIAYNTFLNSQRGQTLDTDTLDEHIVYVESEENLTDMERDLEKALLSLPVRAQAIFHLHYKKGLTLEEISTILDHPHGTIKSDLLRGREKLATQLESWRVK